MSTQGAAGGPDGSLGHGDARVGRGSAWATWTPPEGMAARQPEAAKSAAGTPGGPDSPLGARTLHLDQDGKYRPCTIDADGGPDTVGHGTTGGCVGPLGQDMIDPHARTPVRTRVVLLEG